MGERIDRGFSHIPVTIVDMDSNYKSGPVTPGSMDPDAYRIYVEAGDPHGEVQKARQSLQANPGRVKLDQVVDSINY